ncbi:anti-sigma factor family protein [Pseudooceanicola sp. C21-150M6]|uniref:anti-sigma factor family protein n=1 Tax=Pseudooceanicola sp. C21-150M6 TaxID=3434355 RepID=UPI003D7F5BF8
MTPDAELLIHLYVDGELTEEEARAFERRMEEDADLAARVADLLSQNDRIRSEIPMPSEGHLNRLLEGAGSNPDRSNPDGVRRFAPLAPLARIAAAVGLLALGGAGGFGLATLGGGVAPVADLDTTATQAHVLYAAEVVHPVEVTAGQRDHLDGWLSNRLGAEIAAPDLTGQGYDLVGGRLLPFAGQGAAQFMYETGDGSRLTLYAVTTDAPAQSSFRFRQEGALMAVTWQEGIWRYALVGVAGRAAMAEIAQYIHGARL